MKDIIQIIKSSNRPLYYLGIVCLFMAFVCLAMVFTTDTQVLGINAWIKPLKFYLSTVMMTWSMAFFMSYLNKPRSIKIYTWVLTAVFVFELGYITYQAAIGELSHFNATSAFHNLMFGLMGLFISIFTLWTGYIGLLFFRSGHDISEPHLLWGVRLGILLFVIFAFEGMMMGAHMAHTIGAADGGPGLPVTNWSTKAGDLRVAHFFGMHALQLIPAAAYFIFKRSYQVILFAVVYFAFVSYLLYQALQGVPLFSLQ